MLVLFSDRLFYIMREFRLIHCATSLSDEMMVIVSVRFCCLNLKIML